MTRLALFGAVHVDRRGKVVSELASFADGTDALFVEYPVDGLSFRDGARALLAAPVSALGLLLASLLQYPLYALFNRDAVPAEVLAARRLSEERDLPLYAVDDHIISILGTVGRGRTAVEWLLLVATLAFTPVAGAALVTTVVGLWVGLGLVYRLHRLLWVVATVPAVGGASWLLVSRDLVPEPLVLTAVLATFYTVFRTLDRRNGVMVERIVETCEREGHDRACLTTGRAHLAGLATAADERDVTVVASYVPNWLRAGDVVAGGEPQRVGVAPVRGDLDTAGDVFGRRVAALAVDWVFIAVAAVAFGVVAGTVGRLVVGDGALVGGFFVGAFCAWAGYWVGLEARTGQTVGKRLLGLVVVGRDGSRVSRRGAVLRNLLRPVDFLVGYALGGVVSLISHDGQRLGDHAAGTLVVRAERAE
ncbi:Uncharacterized membrane protein YckC, RDD family [Halogranum gelatinilyticum]|uniref:Uncharacterized membrane protein YckC, RDD family n=1 Tax=Halogranum gelatinilyticum TaxID=660521 RepID=A0A1G9RGG5_9EURY|nr:RDD family protein [Halogranum gelatinilyticum]SDM22326.1 Uncharacterized membrane protein YckC, RDD family [Halogranum gelatinilyticum]